MNKKFYNPDLDLGIDTTHDYPEDIVLVHENLPIFPSYSVCIAPPKSGKTLMTVNFIHKVKKVFKGRIVIFTGNMCKTLFKLEETCGAKIFTSLYDSEGNDRLQKIIDFQFKRKKNGEKLEQILIVLDDFANNKLFSKR